MGGWKFWDWFEGGGASFGLAICRKIESLREKTAFNGVKESVVLQGGLPVIALRDISQPLRDKTEGGAKTEAARIRDIPRPCGLKPVLLPFEGGKCLRERKVRLAYRVRVDWLYCLTPKGLI